jgi:hypothetical protein
VVLDPCVCFMQGVAEQLSMLLTEHFCVFGAVLLSVNSMLAWSSMLVLCIFVHS